MARLANGSTIPNAGSLKVAKPTVLNLGLGFIDVDEFAL